MLIGAHKDLITMNKNMKIRPIVSGEYIFLDDFLYDAIFIPEGIMPLRRILPNILNCKKLIMPSKCI
jgi:hypothetical protein